MINLFYDSGEDFTEIIENVLKHKKEQQLILSYQPTKNKYQFKFHYCTETTVVLGVSKLSIQKLDFNQQLEDELTKMVKLFKDAQRIAQLGYWDFDIKTGRLWGTKECRNILKLDPNTPILSIPQIKKNIHPDDMNILKENLFNNKGDNFSVTFKMMHGKLIQHLIVEGDIERDGNEKIIRVFGVLRDISSRKERDDQLNRKLQIEKAVSRISFGFIQTNDRVEALENALKETSLAAGADRASLLLLNSNEEPQELIQWNNKNSNPLFFVINKKKQLETLCKKVSLTPSDYYTANSLKDIKEIELKNYLKKIKTKSVAIQRFARNQRTAFYLIFETLKDEQQWSANDQYLIKIAGFLINNQIIEKDYEIALIESEKKYKDLFDQMTNGFALFSPITNNKKIVTELSFIEMNRALCRLVSKKEEKLIGKQLKDIFPSDYKEWLPEINRVFDTGKPETKIYELQDVDCHLEISIFITHEEKIAMLFKDISDQKKMEENLRQMEKLQVVGQLAGGIAHDFNNQLMGIMGYGSMLESMLENDEQLEYLKLILTSAKRSSELTRKLLDFSRKGKILSIPINIDELVVETTSMLRHTVDKKIRLRKYLRTEDALFKGDPSQIQNALLNIGINACDAMPDGGNLSIYTRICELSQDQISELVFEIPPGEYLQVRMIDTGEGMSKETISKMFEPFYTTKKDNKGTGMGLAAVFGAVKEHKGGIAVKSEPGVGTFFDIFIPYDKTLKEIKAPEIEEINNAEAGVGTILILDDEEILLMMIETILRKEGYEVKSFSQPTKAIKYYQQNYKKIDLVVLDFIMPEKNGTEVFSEMKKINSRIKALLLSGYSPDMQIQKLISKGILGFIQKPVDKNLLTKRVKAAIK